MQACQNNVSRMLLNRFFDRITEAVWSIHKSAQTSIVNTGLNRFRCMFATVCRQLFGSHSDDAILTSTSVEVLLKFLSTFSLLQYWLTQIISKMMKKANLDIYS